MITALYTAERTDGRREACCRAHYNIAADCPDTVEMHNEVAPDPRCGWCLAEADVLAAQSAPRRPMPTNSWWPDWGGR